MIVLSSRISGVDEDVPKLLLFGADMSISRRLVKPFKYGSSCGPRTVTPSEKIIC